MAKKNKKENKKGGTDPKAAALAFLNINLGSKNIRTLKKEEVHAAFVKQLHISETTPQDVVHPPRIPSKNEYQRYLHESYQYIVHLIVEQQKIEDERRLYERDPGKKDQEEEDLFANVKKIRAKLRSTDAESIASSR